MGIEDKLRSFAKSRESPDVVCCGLTYRDIREAHATIADLRSRLALFADHVCEGCGCAVREDNESVCYDCARVGLALESYAGACISVGMRALCGRRILESEMSNSQWHADQAHGERALREANELKERDKAALIELRAIVLEMWLDAEHWSGPSASSHYRSRVADRLRTLGVRIP